MARGPNSRGRPPAGSGPKADSLAKGHQGFADAMVTDAGDNGRPPPGGRVLSLAFASQAEPSAGRTTWHIMYACHACGGTHFGRSREQLVTGKRLARCGRRVWLIISRNYPAGSDTGAAA
jgi:hypothetical protein